MMNPISQHTNLLELAENIKALESELQSEKDNLISRIKMFPGLNHYQPKLIIANLRGAIIVAKKKYNAAIQELRPYSIN